MRLDAANLRFINLVDQTARQRSGALSRLATGLRIQRAADDAAGMAVSTTLDVRAVSTRAARRNIHSALATVQVADEGASHILDELSRARQLAVAAASETASDTDRSLIQEEISEILDQIDETAGGAVYGNDNIKLLAGGHIEIAFLVDTSYSMGQEISALQAGIADFEAAIVDQGFSVQFALAEYRYSVDNLDGVDTLAVLDDPGFDAALAGLGITVGQVDPYAAMLQASGITAEASTTGSDAVGFTDAAKERHIIMLTDTDRERDLLDAPDDQQSVADALDDNQITVHVIGHSGNEGDYSGIINETGGSWSELGLSGNNVSNALSSIASQITKAATFPAPITFQIGVDNAESSRLVLELPINATPQGLGLAGLGVTTVEDARQALDDLDSAVDFMAGQRARFGGWMRRIQHALDHNIAEEAGLTRALSTIRDADMAAASTDAARLAIQQRASTTGLKVHRTMSRVLVSRLLG